MIKINNTISLLGVSIALFLSALVAQQGWANVLGQEYRYKIGTSDNPVSVPVFTKYLNRCARFDGEYFHLGFMGTGWCFGLTGHAAIKRNSEQFPYWAPQYSYSVIPGHENDIIDGVQSQQIQQEFQDWQNYPDTQEYFHLGSKNGYKIGTSDNPVFALEYVDFLNYYAQIGNWVCLGDNISDRFLSQYLSYSASSYADWSFMKRDNTHWYAEKQDFRYSDSGGDYTSRYRDVAIVEFRYASGFEFYTQNARYQHKFHFNYIVIPGHEQDIIDTVDTQEIQQQFEQWRSNPNL